MAYPTGIEVVGLERLGGEGQDGLTLTFQAQGGALALNNVTNSAILVEGLFLNLQEQSPIYTSAGDGVTFYLPHTSTFTAYNTVTASITAEASFNAYGSMTASLTTEASFSAYAAYTAELTTEAEFLVYAERTVDLPVEAAYNSYQTFQVSVPAEAGLSVYSAKTTSLPAESSFSVYNAATATLPAEATYNSFNGFTAALPAESAFNVYAQAYTSLPAESSFSVYAQVYAELPAEAAFNAYVEWIANLPAEAVFNAYNAVYVELPVEAGFDVTQPYAAWAINLDNNAVSKYEGFNFDVLLPEYACNADGVFSLGGTTDDGTTISAFVETGYIRFDDGPFMSRVSDYYQEGTFGRMTLSVQPEHESAVKYTVAAATADVRKVNLARGPKGKAWKFKLANYNGSTAEVDNQALVVDQLSRRVR